MCMLSVNECSPCTSVPANWPKPAQTACCKSSLAWCNDQLSSVINKQQATINRACALQDLRGGLAGAGEEVKVQLGRMLRRLGKLGLVRPGALPEASCLS